MKKFFALMLVVVMATLMFACGGTQNETTAPTEPSETAQSTESSATTYVTEATEPTQTTQTSTEATEPTEATEATEPPVTPGTDDYEKSLVAHWNFEENANGVLVDVSGNGHDGTITGTPTIVDGLDGKAFSFTALGQYIEVEKADGLGFAANESFSLVATFKWDGTSPDNWPCIINNGLLIATKSYAYYGFWINHTNSIPQFGISNATATGTRNIAPSNYRLDTNWHTFAMVQDGDANTLTFYIDGIEVGAVEAINAATQANLFIAYNGNAGNQGQFAGIIDDIRIYSCALSEADLKAMSEF